MNTQRIENFKKKYGEAIIANGLRLRPDDFMDEVEWRDAVDQHYTKIWLEFTYGGLYARCALDERTLVLLQRAVLGAQPLHSRRSLKARSVAARASLLGSAQLRAGAGKLRREGVALGHALRGAEG